MLYHLRDQVSKFPTAPQTAAERSPLTASSVTGIWRSPSGWRISSAGCGTGRTRISSWPFIWLWRICGTWTPLPESFHLFFQPHFHNYHCTLGANDQNRAVLDSPEYQERAGLLPPQGASSISKRLPPAPSHHLHRARVRFMQRQIDEWKPGPGAADNPPTSSTERVLNRNYMVDWQDRLFQDSVLVRFEDGKLNPKATFTALAEFLDLPYTKSMTYCSRRRQ